jgi:hypothetical protein
MPGYRLLFIVVAWFFLSGCSAGPFLAIFRNIFFLAVAARLARPFERFILKRLLEFDRSLAVPMLAGLDSWTVTNFLSVSFANHMRTPGPHSEKIAGSILVQVVSFFFSFVFDDGASFVEFLPNFICLCAADVELCGHILNGFLLVNDTPNQFDFVLNNSKVT